MRSLLLLLCLAASGCSNLDILADTEPLQDVLGASAPMAWSAALAMDAIGGDVAPCVELAAGCNGDDCISAITIDASHDACPFPFAGEVTGTIGMIGAWAGADTAGITFDLGDVRVDGRGLRVDAVEGAIVTRSDDPIDDVTNTTVSWVWEWVDVDTEPDLAAIDIDQEGWTTTAADPLTPGDPSDDTITVTGGAQHVIDTTNIRDVILAPGAVFDPSCGLNPVAGEALVVEVGADDGGGDEWSFHEECDGRADRLGGLLRNSVAVDLLR